MADRLSYSKKHERKLTSHHTHNFSINTQSLEGKKTVPHHSSRVIVISMDSEHRQANIEVWVFIIYLTKSENTTENFL
jgi:hypothetical protein